MNFDIVASMLLYTVHISVADLEILVGGGEHLLVTRGGLGQHQLRLKTPCHGSVHDRFIFLSGVLSNR